MKKILIIAFIIGFVFAGNALAELEVGGTLEVLEMTIYEATNPDEADEIIQICDVTFRFVTDQPPGEEQTYVLEGTAFGNAINNALWDAALWGFTPYAVLQYSLPPTWYVDIHSITYD